MTGHGLAQAVSEKWRPALPADSSCYAVPINRHGRRRLAGELLGLPAGSRVVLYDHWPGSRRRCRAVASRGGVQLFREYVALPTLSSAGVLVEDDDAVASYVASRFGSVPPAAGLRARLLVWLVPLAGRILAGRWRGLAFGGRVVIGVRP